MTGRAAALAAIVELTSTGGDPHVAFSAHIANYGTQPRANEIERREKLRDKGDDRSHLIDLWRRQHVEKLEDARRDPGAL